jgi:hypothetical protein
MDHLTYIMASYGSTVVLAGAYSIAAWVRMGRARKRLAAIDPRAREMGRDTHSDLGRQPGRLRG